MAEKGSGAAWASCRGGVFGREACVLGGAHEGRVQTEGDAPLFELFLGDTEAGCSGSPSASPHPGWCVHYGVMMKAR